MRYLGVDYGERKIGLAISDGEGKIAFPYAVVKGPNDVCAVIKKEGINTVIIGLPLSSTGREDQQAKKARTFAADLTKKLQLLETGSAAGETVIDFENEIFTTKIAEQASPRDKADASAAALILQSYLDRLKSEARSAK